MLGPHAATNEIRRSVATRKWWVIGGFVLSCCAQSCESVTEAGRIWRRCRWRQAHFYPCSLHPIRPFVRRSPTSHVLVIELQRRPDECKRTSWLAHVVALRAQHQFAVTPRVICPTRRTMGPSDDRVWNKSAFVANGGWPRRAAAGALVSTWERARVRACGARGSLTRRGARGIETSKIAGRRGVGVQAAA